MHLTGCHSDNHSLNLLIGWLSVWQTKTCLIRQHIDTFRELDFVSVPGNNLTPIYIWRPKLTFGGRSWGRGSHLPAFPTYPLYHHFPNLPKHTLHQKELSYIDTEEGGGAGQRENWEEIPVSTSDQVWRYLKIETTADFIQKEPKNSILVNLPKCS